MKKSKGQIILFIIALVLFITVVPTAIYTNRHYSIDIITSIVLVSLVWLIFYFYKTPRLDNKILFFFEVIISRKFLLNSNKVPVKYLLILASPFVLLGGVDIAMMFASVVM
jgi:membrane-associated phospholipid phosphatase